MATRGWSGVKLSDLQQAGTTTRAKYGNVKVRINGELFDSKREAAYWQGLKAREHNGEITQLRRQVLFPLCCPVEDRDVMVAAYIADFVYVEHGVRHLSLIHI